MTSVEYQHSWWLLLIPAILGGLAFSRVAAAPSARGKAVTLVAGLICVLSGCALAATYLVRERQIRRAYQHGEVLVIEGNPLGFRPEDERAKTPEEFSVGGVRFAYSRFQDFGGVNDLRRYRALLQSRGRVRVEYLESRLGNRILRIEFLETGGTR